MKNYETVIGLEVHVELATKTKIFCSCSTAFGGAPNTHTCPVCTGMPGTLPVINQTAVEYAVKAGMALGCDISKFSVFDRKNYFYPDNPQNYQISQVQYGWNVSFNMTHADRNYTVNMMVYTLTGQTVLNLLTLSNTIRYVGYIQPLSKD